MFDTQGMKRRDFLGAAGASTIGSLMFGAGIASAAQPGSIELAPMSLEGANLAGWETVVGDGIFAPPGVPAVVIGDIATIDYPTHSELLANVQERPAMVHNIAFKRLTGNSLFDFTHDCSYEFRMPHLDTPGNPGVKAQTVEGGLFVWDGGNSRRDYGLGFQWVLNPWDPKYGAIQTWSMSREGWKTTGELDPDNEWHLFEANIDHRRNKAAISIDGVELSTTYTHRRKPEYWGTETAARLQVEAISLDPGTSSTSAPTHSVEVRNWTWNCVPNV